MIKIQGLLTTSITEAIVGYDKNARFAVRTSITEAIVRLWWKCKVCC